MPDPYRHHPELADLIKPADGTVLRGLDLEDLRAIIVQNGVPPNYVLDDATREADRRAALTGHEGDLWVFAYGSLMWDPGMRFDEVRHAHAPDHERRFILKDILGGRGTAERPGLMAALDHGAGCHGLAFRLPAETAEADSRLLWRREKIVPAYLTEFIPLETAAGPLTALAFVADHSALLMDATLTWEQQVEYCATGTGFLGDSIDYLRNLARHFAALGIEDQNVSNLLRAAEAHLAE